MRNFLFFLALFSCGMLKAQEPDEAEVRAAIDSFFEGFHLRDTVLLRKAVSPEAILQTIIRDNKGEYQVKNENFDLFIKSLSGLPEDTRFREELTEYSILSDGVLAQAWTPYTFWLNDSISHCGVNSFQLLKTKAGWQIFYLVDTRRKEGCR